MGLAEDGEFYPYVPQSGKEELLAWNMENGDSAYQSLGYGTVGSAVPWWPILLGGLLLLGAGAALGGSSGGGSDKKDDPQDTTAPAEPKLVHLNKEGSLVKGAGEPGSTVLVKDSAGNIIATDIVNEEGGFEVEIDPAKVNGETISVSLICQ